MIADNFDLGAIRQAAPRTVSAPLTSMLTMQRRVVD
jgi:hypothetical protein